MFRFQNLIFIARSTLSDTERGIVFNTARANGRVFFPTVPYHRRGTAILYEKSQSFGQKIEYLNSMELPIQYLHRDEVESILDGAGRAYWADMGRD
jgi:hypothetical protein